MKRRALIFAPITLGIFAYLCGIYAIFAAAFYIIGFAFSGGRNLWYLIIPITVCISMFAIGTALVKAGWRIKKSNEANPSFSALEKGLMIIPMVILAFVIFVSIATLLASNTV